MQISDEMPPFHFDRYINGVLMAEGVTIERQDTLAGAMREAARLASRGPNNETPVLVCRPAVLSLPVQPVAWPSVRQVDGLMNMAWEMARHSNAEGRQHCAMELRMAIEALATPPAPPAVPSAGGRETGWLIERKFPINSIGATEPRWYAERSNGDHWWTPVPNDAKRFALKSDVEAYPAYQMIASDPTISITEHVWINDGFSWSHGRVAVPSEEDDLIAAREAAASPCGIASPSYNDCPNMKEVGGGMEGERYWCALCSKGYFLDYEDMK